MSLLCRMTGSVRQDDSEDSNKQVIEVLEYLDVLATLLEPRSAGQLTSNLVARSWPMGSGLVSSKGQLGAQFHHLQERTSGWNKLDGRQSKETNFW